MGHFPPMAESEDVARMKAYLEGRKIRTGVRVEFGSALDADIDRLLNRIALDGSFREQQKYKNERTSDFLRSLRHKDSCACYQATGKECLCGLSSILRLHNLPEPPP